MILALAGGVGGAKLCDGLAGIAGEALTVVVNTADDFDYLGLHISPDLDTVMYTLAGLANPVTGWGIRDDSWTWLDQIKRMGGPIWFRVGDRDLATHVLRTERLRAGATLTEVTRQFSRALGIKSRILPMSDDPVRTMVDTEEGLLPFQEYFVARRADVPVRGFRFDGLECARFSTELASALRDPTLEAIVICPSNPFVSIEPILGVQGLRDLIRDTSVPVVAVSPIIGAEAVKGPAARMIRDLGAKPSASYIASHYSGLLSAILIDHANGDESESIQANGIAVHVTDIMMRSSHERRRLALECLAVAGQIRS